MADLLNGFVKNVMDETINNEYPHIRHPALVYAKVKETIQKDGISYGTIQVLQEDKTEDDTFPPFPYVRSELGIKTGDIVVIGLLYGGCIPYILGRCHDGSG